MKKFRSNEMKQIKDLFSVYKKRLKPPQSSVEKKAVEIISEICSIEIRLDQVTYTPHTKTLSVTVPSILKTEIKHKQSQILSALESLLGKENSPKTII